MHSQKYTNAVMAFGGDLSALSDLLGAPGGYDDVRGEREGHACV